MTSLAERVECPELLAKAMPVDDAVKLVSSRGTLAISGFTKAGEPKVFLPALARHFAATASDAKIALLSGASLAEEVEAPLAPFIAKRGPYMSSSASRRLIHKEDMEFSDVHLSHFARNLMYGFYGEVDLAVVEVSRIRKDGSVVLTSSVGISAEALDRAKHVVLEVNTAGADYTGFHDIVLPPVHPHVGWPIPITNVIDRVGTPYVSFDPKKVVAVVESERLPGVVQGHHGGRSRHRSERRRVPREVSRPLRLGQADPAAAVRGRQHRQRSDRRALRLAVHPATLLDRGLPGRDDALRRG
jgi:acetyl-CoA hydrolase